MIPLGVCQINQWQNIATATVIFAIGLLVGAALAIRPGRLGVPASIVLTLLLSAIMPVALVKEVWPFNASEPSCGFTPDPNAWVISATLLLPVFGLVGLFGILQLRRRSKWRPPN
jgi:hypothetical protein